jgi:hypothetical protein
LGKTFANGEDTGDCRGAHCAKTNKKNTQLAAGGSNLKWCSHGRRLYHEEN